MDLKEFIFDDILILKLFPYTSRAPPKKILEDYVPPANDIIYSRYENDDLEMEFNQLRTETDEDFNQDLTW